MLSEWGWALIDAGKADEADRVFTRLLKDFPDSPNAADARFNLAESAYQAKDFDHGGHPPDPPRRRRREGPPQADPIGPLSPGADPGRAQGLGRRRRDLRPADHAISR